MARTPYAGESLPSNTQNHFRLPEPPRHSTLKAAGVTFGIMALLALGVTLFNPLDWSNSRRQDRGWQRLKSEQADILVDLRQSYQPGGSLLIQGGFLDDMALIQLRLQKAFPERFGYASLALNALASEIRGAITNYNRRVGEMASERVLDLRLLNTPTAFREDRATVRSFSLAAQDLQRRAAASRETLFQALTGTRLTEDEAAVARLAAELDRFIHRERTIILQLAESAREVSDAMLGILELLSGPDADWFYERRTGFPVFEKASHEDQFDFHIRTIARELNAETGLRNPFIPLD